MFRLKSGKRKPFEVSRAVFPVFDDPHVDLRTDEDRYPPYVHFENLTSRFGEPLYPGIMLKQDQNILFRVRVSIPESPKGGRLQITDPLPLGLAYLNYSARMGDMQITPEVTPAGLIWEIDFAPEHKSVEFEYACQATKIVVLPDSEGIIKVRIK